ncbi:hypothetical protein MNBD_UNCLBAC01-23 [hydrothermal vent metagenome]|uniref:Uncharacterized protein n=1 Tax=hydrothermal vent metagenome TaxID=652676 RepID=A0A3B1DK25_9ZZZZ
MTKIIIFLSLCSLVIFPTVNSAQDLNPLQVIFEKATEALSEGNYSRAIDLYEKTLNIHPDFAQAYYYLGLAHRGAGTDLREVVWLFKRATELKSDYADAYDNLARSYYAMGMFDEATEAALAAVNIDDDLASAHLALGWVYLLGKDQPEDALYHFEKAIKQADTPYAHFGLGMAYAKAGQKFRALEMITILRQRGEETSAKQLEDMVRYGKEVNPPIHLAPLVMPQRTKGTLVKETPSFEPNKNFSGDMKVRLKEKMATIEDAPQSFPINSPQSGASRIRALQRKTINQSKGSGY